MKLTMPQVMIMDTEKNSRAALKRQNDLIASVYSESRPAVYGYIYKRIRRKDVAEDLTQDVFCRLLEYNCFLDKATVMHFVFLIARNLVIDYFRRHACGAVAFEYFSTHTKRESNHTEEDVTEKEILRMERRAVAELPKRKQQIYSLCVIYGCTADEVSKRLQLSKRTVENHLFNARARVRISMATAV